ncbi:MAG: LytTR family transcriptional regulator [Clostridiales bacterium]|nr:LytTR family transcriptional regulator [Clostridiales bacterium]
MKINIETVENLTEDEIIIRCRKPTKAIQKICQLIADEAFASPKLVYYKKNEEYYFPLDDVLFFETSGENVYAHTADDSFRIKFRLYELVEMLPGHFVRAAKSTIINIRHILSIDRNLASASLVQFHGSHKKVYVSRLYYQTLKCRLSERSNYED